MRLDRSGLDVSGFAARAGVPVGTASRWVNARRIPSTEYAPRIAEALGVAPEEVLYHAGHLPSLPQPESAYERARVLRELGRTAHAGIERIQEVSSDRSQSPVRYYGRVPADAVRWVEARESGAVEQVWDQFLAGRSPSEFLTVTASGDCLGRRGILDDDTVLLEWANGRVPSNGRIVLVRLGDEFTLKIWWRDGDWVELRDGDGNVIARLSILAEFEVLGLYVNRWSPVGKSGE